MSVGTRLVDVVGGERAKLCKYRGDMVFCERNQNLKFEDASPTNFARAPSDGFRKTR